MTARWYERHWLVFLAFSYGYWVSQIRRDFRKCPK